MIAGFGYGIHSLTQMLAPSLAANLFPWILLPAAVAEGWLCLWLIVKAVDAPLLVRR